MNENVIELRITVDSANSALLGATVSIPAPKVPRPGKELEGAFVFLEAIGREANGQARSGYYNDEYVVMRQTPLNLYCVRAKVGNQFRNFYPSAFRIGGADPEYAVIEVRRDDAAARQLAADNLQWGENPPTPPQWLPYVYKEVADKARELQCTLDRL